MIIKDKINQFKNINDAEAVKLHDQIHKEMTEKIINSKDDLPKTGRTIYVSEFGDDANDGLSPDTPKKTLKHVRNMTEKGDRILLKRGEMFRGFLCAFDNVSIGAYGKGRKPIINGSAMNYAKAELWKKTEYKNVYVCTETFLNVGLILFNPAYEYGKYDENYGDMWFNSVEELHKEYDFYFDLDKNKLYVYCDKNPGEKYEDIEIGDNICLIIGDGKNVTIDNLWLMITGIHGVSMHKCENRTITNCVFSWIGGAMYWIREFPDTKEKRYVRYGNAVEIFGECKKLTVKNTWTYQIFDTGLTFQNSYQGNQRPCLHDNVIFENNVIEYHFWGIEFYNINKRGGDIQQGRDTTNISIKGNFITKAGYGWGCNERNRHYPARNICGNGIDGVIKNFVFENNIISNCNGYLVYVAKRISEEAEFIENVYLDPKDKVAFFSGNPERPIINFDNNVKDELINTLGNKNPIVKFMV